MQYCSPDSAAENHISFPDGVHARPSSDSHPVDKVRRCPERSTTTTSPRSSWLGGCLNNATSFPSGDTLGSLIQFWLSINTFPTGYSKRQLSPARSITARSLPSGDQSASKTCSSSSRGAPPPIGEVASVPAH